jgi:hypothetical protein
LADERIFLRGLQNSHWASVGVLKALPDLVSSNPAIWRGVNVHTVPSTEWLAFHRHRQKARARQYGPGALATRGHPPDLYGKKYSPMSELLIK